MTEHLDTHFKAQFCAPLLRVVKAMNSANISIKDFSDGSQYGQERLASERFLKAPVNYVSIPGLADYIVRSISIAGTHILAAGRLLLESHVYFPSSSVMALARISVEASANARWLCDNTADWKVRLERFGSMFIDRMTAGQGDLLHDIELGAYDGKTAALTADAVSSIEAAKQEMSVNGLALVKVPPHAQRVKAMQRATGAVVPQFYALTSKAIHADPIVESFAVSSEGNLRDQVMSATFLWAACVYRAYVVNLVCSWQGVSPADVESDLRLMGDIGQQWRGMIEP